MSDFATWKAREDYAARFASDDVQFRKRIFNGKCDECAWMQDRIFVLRSQSKQITSDNGESEK